jgi:hypothetical protein
MNDEFRGPVPKGSQALWRRNKICGVNVAIQGMLTIAATSRLVISGLSYAN